MAKFLYVQAIYWELKSAERIAPFLTHEKDLTFRHTAVEADDEDNAYLFGQRIFPSCPPGACFLNDYVIELEANADPRAARTGMKL
jgi:hypothetical protein